MKQWNKAFPSDVVKMYCIALRPCLLLRIYFPLPKYKVKRPCMFYDQLALQLDAGIIFLLNKYGTVFFKERHPPLEAPSSKNILLQKICGRLVLKGNVALFQDADQFCHPCEAFFHLIYGKELKKTENRGRKNRQSPTSPPPSHTFGGQRSKRRRRRR